MIEIMVQCLRCHLPKVPLGRSVPWGMFGAYCTSDCPGYREEPIPGSLWPNETWEEYGGLLPSSIEGGQPTKLTVK